MSFLNVALLSLILTAAQVGSQGQPSSWLGIARARNINVHHVSVCTGSCHNSEALILISSQEQALAKGRSRTFTGLSS